MINLDKAIPGDRFEVADGDVWTYVGREALDETLHVLTDRFMVKGYFRDAPGDKPTTSSIAAGKAATRIEVLTRALDEATSIIRALLQHSGISDIPAEDKFDEDHAAERAAREWIEKHGGGYV